MLETTHHWLPVIVAIYLPVTFFITYGIALGRKHVAAAFPYISDTGTMPPESCVFGQLLNIGAILGGIIIYIRYRHIFVHFETTPDSRCLLRLNTAAFVIGMLMMFGISLVANFQETNIVVVHLIGAALAFGIGFVYCILQTVISYKVSTSVELPGNGVCIRRTRIALCVIDFILLVILLTMNPISHEMGPGKGKSKLHWSSDDPGYTEHVVATVSEWLVSFVTVIYLATYYTEFKHFRVRPSKLEYYDADLLREHERPTEEREPLNRNTVPKYSSIDTADA